MGLTEQKCVVFTSPLYQDVKIGRKYRVAEFSKGKRWYHYSDPAKSHVLCGFLRGYVHCLQADKLEAAQTSTMGSRCWSWCSTCGWRESGCRTLKMCLGRKLISKLLAFLTTLRELSHRAQTVSGIGNSEDSHQAGPPPHGAWCRGISAYFPSVVCRKVHPLPRIYPCHGPWAW